jgi:hypothetical protein
MVCWATPFLARAGKPRPDFQKKFLKTDNVIERRYDVKGENVHESETTRRWDSICKRTVSRD